MMMNSCISLVPPPLHGPLLPGRVASWDCFPSSCIAYHFIGCIAGQAWTDPALAVPAMDTDKDGAQNQIPNTTIKYLCVTGKVDREEFLTYTEPLTAVIILASSQLVEL